MLTLIYSDAFSTVPIDFALIRDIVARGLHVVPRLKNNDTRYLFRRNGQNKPVTLKALFAKLKKIPAPVREAQQETEDILGSFHVELFPSKEHDAVPVKIVFLKKRSKSGENWIAIITTDMSLSNAEITQMYAKRWKIEEFFKVVKSLLCLETEFQGRSYDMLIAHTTIVSLYFS